MSAVTPPSRAKRTRQRNVSVDAESNARAKSSSTNENTNERLALHPPPSPADMHDSAQMPKLAKRSPQLPQPVTMTTCQSSTAIMNKLQSTNPTAFLLLDSSNNILEPTVVSNNNFGHSDVLTALEGIVDDMPENELRTSVRCLRQLLRCHNKKRQRLSLEARIFTQANTGGFGLHDLVERGPVAYVCNMAKLATRYPRVYDRLLEDASRAADFETHKKAVTHHNYKPSQHKHKKHHGTLTYNKRQRRVEVHVQRAGFQMATVKDAATQRPAEIIALRSKAALDDLMAKCALDLQQAYLASREWGVSTVLTMRGRDKLRRLSDTTFAIAVVSMMGFGLHELINIKPTDKCPLCSSKTPPRLTREHLLTCRPIKRHNALRDEMGRLLRYATLSHVWVEKSGYNANGQSCRIDLHCRNPFPGGALGPALPDLGIDATVRTAQPPTTSQACIKVGAALRRAEKEKREYYTGFNHGKTLIVPAAMTTTGGFASSFVDLLGQLARCAEARGVYQPGLDEAFVPRWKGRFAALVHQMNADHIQRHFGGVCLRSS
ncbi:uncharacterized protein MONBRDRAFT_8728 [Monosiga brevicollis MX1]|uniref:Uncharacterized protein n=1 Tax=Monosiga brevicollis TaxID=81824 RepID=A9V0Y1_MONBE|nr:uncharacterized protein MONBRDRAFT_8728 [Monosiga brevicollis MX1]EDQ88835.1 predicted protein [Monosiga brevicollis MX1]|eukprot:XP_001746448.1 hypothetical protein [Monosiga brevicollis MX1]